VWEGHVLNNREGGGRGGVCLGYGIVILPFLKKK
jgi:hypothetical protein